MKTATIKKMNGYATKETVAKKTQPEKKVVLGTGRGTFTYIADDAFEPMELVPAGNGWTL